MITRLQTEDPYQYERGGEEEEYGEEDDGEEEEVCNRRHHSLLVSISRLPLLLSVAQFLFVLSCAFILSPTTQFPQLALSQHLQARVFTAAEPQAECSPDLACMPPCNPVRTSFPCFCCVADSTDRRSYILTPWELYHYLVQVTYTLCLSRTPQGAEDLLSESSEGDCGGFYATEMGRSHTSPP